MQAQPQPPKTSSQQAQAGPPQRPNPAEAHQADASSHAPQVLARGPWPLERVTARWLEDQYEPPAAHTKLADAAMASLRQRGSPSHDGMSGRLVDFHLTDGGIVLELQPSRWALRLVPANASKSMAALCVVRSSDGRWLAGRRAPWLASWAGRWALGAGGAVDLGENPADTLIRELQEEWSVAPDRAQAEGLVLLPHQLVMFVGQAWLPASAQVTRDHEHDAHAWWPAQIEDWPDHAEEPLRQMARWLLP